MSFLPRMTLCSKCGKLHPVTCPGDAHDVVAFAASEATVARLREELAAKDAEASHYRKEFLSADGYLTLTRADLAAARLFLAEARGLLAEPMPRFCYHHQERSHPACGKCWACRRDAFLTPPVPPACTCTPYRGRDVHDASCPSLRASLAATPPPCATCDKGRVSSSDPRYAGFYYCDCPLGLALHGAGCKCAKHAGAPRNPAKPPCETCGGSGRKVDAMARIGSRPCPACTPGAK